MSRCRYVGLKVWAEVEKKPQDITASKKKKLADRNLKEGKHDENPMENAGEFWLWQF